jgi:hypothetical protein
MNMYKFAPCALTVVVACGDAGSGAFYNPPGSSLDASQDSSLAEAGAAAPDASGAAPDSGNTTETGVAATEAGTGGDSADASTGSEAAVPPPPTVLPCDQVAAVGTWENITPPGVDLSKRVSQAFVLDPVHPGTVYAGFGNLNLTPGAGSAIWKTSDCGATWTVADTGTSATDLDNGMPWTMAIDFVDPQVLYTISGYGTMGVFKSTNGGVDWNQILPADIASVLVDGGFIERVTMDPTNNQHLIVTPHFNCQNGHSNCMLETTDSGGTWRIIDGTPDSGEDSGQVMVDSKTWYWMNPTGIFRTTNGGSSWSQVYSGWSFESYYRSPLGPYYIMSAQNGVLQSNDGVSWTAIPNSPSGRALIGDGTTLFTSNRNAYSDPYKPYSSAPESNPATWATYPSPAVTQGGWLLHYDASHGILYSSAEHAGFWRVRTK